MKVLIRSFLALTALSASLRALATDTTPPTLSIQQSWIEKVGSVYHFKMNLDPQDDVGIDKIEFRTALNTTAALPANAAWAEHVWTRGQPFDEGFICTAIVIEVRAVDAAGNASPLQRRTFKAPFPLSAAPNLDPKFSVPTYLTFSGPTMDCKGLFAADFNGDGVDDLAQFDNGAGLIKVRRHNTDGTFSSRVITLAAGTIQDGAIGDFDHDGRMDLIAVVNHDVVEYHNDGNDVNGLPDFTAITPPGRLNSTLTTVEHVAVMDLSGDGYPEAVISGTGADAKVRMDVLVNDSSGSLFGFNTALAPTGASAGRIAVGDLTGDGKPDVAMVDKTGRRVIVFQWLSNGVLGGEDDPVAGNRPLRPSTTRGGEAIAIGDLTGDGHDDLVVTEHYYGQLLAPPVYADGMNHNALLWQVITYDPVNGLQTSPSFEVVSAGPGGAASTPFNSDVLIRDYTGDRFPEIVVTDDVGGGVRTIRLDFMLDDQNREVSGYYPFGGTGPSVKSFAAAAHPQRLAAAHYSAGTKFDLVVGSGDTNQISWLFNTFGASTKANDIVGGASTASDPSGTPNSAGVLAYTEFPDGLVNYSLTYVNNTATAITGATVECALPASLTFVSGSAGNMVTTAGTTQFVRWTVDVPANTSAIQTLTARVKSTVPGTYMDAKASFKKGTKVLASTTMPRITVREPLLFTLEVSSDSDPTGFSVHKAEAMQYRFNLTNNGSTTLTNVKLGTAFPTGTTFLIASTPPPGVSESHRGASGKEMGIDWTVASVPPGGFVSVFVLVNVTAAELGTITESTATCTRGTTKIVAPAFKTTVKRSLEILLSRDLTIARPGDLVHFQFDVHNWGTVPLTNARIACLLPQGMMLRAVNTNDGTGNFIDAALNGDQITGTTNPAVDRSGGPTLSTLMWTWPAFPAHAGRTARFTCQVMYDDPLFYYLNNTSVTNIVSIQEYNFVGNTSASSRLFAAKAVSSSATTAKPLDMLSTAVPVISAQLSGGEPLAPPALLLQKEAQGDGLAQVSGENVPTVINDAAALTDGFFTYSLKVTNSAGAGTATNVQVHDFLPAGANYAGELKLDGTLVPSFTNFHFLDAAKKEVDASIPANLAKIRSFTLPLYDFAGGQTHVFTYKVQATLAAGGTITSNSGGMAGKVSLYMFDPVVGYHLTASNLNFPINGGPRQLSVLVVPPAKFNLPFGVIRSRGQAVGDEVTAIGIPMEVIGGSSLALVDIKMDIPIPKGYLVVSSPIIDNGQQIAVSPTFFDLNRVSTNIAVPAPSSSGIRTLSFPIGARRHATVYFNVAVDPATKSVLMKDGHFTAPLSIKPTVTGSYLKADGKTKVAIAAVSSLGALPFLAAPSGPSPVAAAPLGAAPAVNHPDSKIFVGRCAPAVVRRGQNLTYTIFVGNLTNNILFGGKLTMSIPAGTTYVKASTSKYNYNFRLIDDLDSGPISGGNLPEPIYASGKVTWNIGGLSDSEAGAVSLTVNVPATYAGNRIDDNTCNFDTLNASGKSPGPLGVVVLTGNESAESAAATQAAVEGLGAEYNADVHNALAAKGFKVGSTSCSVSIGGADNMQLQNDVVIIKLASDRTVVLGPPGNVSASGIRLIHDDPMMRIAVGSGKPAGGIGVNVATLPGLSGLPLVTPNSILLGLSRDNLVAAVSGSIVAAGGGNIVGHGSATVVAAGAGNLLEAGAAQLIGEHGSGLSGVNGARFSLPEGAASLSALDAGGHLIGHDGASVVAAGAGNVVAAGGGNIVAAGAGNVVAQGGGNILTQDGAGVVAAGAGNLLTQDGAGVVAAGGGNLVNTNGGNIVSHDGGTFTLANGL